MDETAQSRRAKLLHEMRAEILQKIEDGLAIGEDIETLVVYERELARVDNTFLPPSRRFATVAAVDGAVILLLELEERTGRKSMPLRELEHLLIREGACLGNKRQLPDIRKSIALQTMFTVDKDAETVRLSDHFHAIRAENAKRAKKWIIKQHEEDVKKAKAKRKKAIADRRAS